jgi:hypothetical protein
MNRIVMIAASMKIDRLRIEGEYCHVSKPLLMSIVLDERHTTARWRKSMWSILHFTRPRTIDTCQFSWLDMGNKLEAVVVRAPRVQQ